MILCRKASPFGLRLERDSPAVRAVSPIPGDCMNRLALAVPGLALSGRLEDAKGEQKRNIERIFLRPEGRGILVFAFSSRLSCWIQVVYGWTAGANQVSISTINTLIHAFLRFNGCAFCGLACVGLGAAFEIVDGDFQVN